MTRVAAVQRVSVLLGLCVAAGVAIVWIAPPIASPSAVVNISDWWTHAYADQIKLAQVICDEVAVLQGDPSQVVRLAPRLEDRNVLYAGEPDVEESVRAVTVRDVAYSILDEAGLLPVDGMDRNVKLIAACRFGGEMTRVHIPILDDRDFEAARARLAPLRNGTRSPLEADIDHR